jgi:hypothetical protein
LAELCVLWLPSGAIQHFEGKSSLKHPKCGFIETFPSRTLKQIVIGALTWFLNDSKHLCLQTANKQKTKNENCTDFSITAISRPVCPNCQHVFPLFQFYRVEDVLTHEMWSTASVLPLLSSTSGLLHMPPIFLHIERLQALKPDSGARFDCDLADSNRNSLSDY